MFRNSTATSGSTHEMQHYNHEQEQELAWQKSQYPSAPSGLLSPPLENGGQHTMSYAQAEYLPSEHYFSQPVYYTPSGPHPISPPMYQIPSLSGPNGSEGREYHHQSEESHLPSPTDTFFPSQQQLQQQQQPRAASMSDAASYNPQSNVSSELDIPCRPFISKLAYLLRNPALYGDVIAWDVLGKTFIVAPSDKMVEVVLPAIFSHKSAAAFTRQLTTYGFIHLTGAQLASRFEHSPDSSTPIRQLSAWSSPYFTREDSSRMHKLIPKPSKARSLNQKAKAQAWMHRGSNGDQWKPKGL